MKTTFRLLAPFLLLALLIHSPQAQAVPSLTPGARWCDGNQNPNEIDIYTDYNYGGVFCMTLPALPGNSTYYVPNLSAYGWNDNHQPPYTRINSLYFPDPIGPTKVVLISDISGPSGIRTFTASAPNLGVDYTVSIRVTYRSLLPADIESEGGYTCALGTNPPPGQVFLYNGQNYGGTCMAVPIYGWCSDTRPYFWDGAFPVHSFKMGQPTNGWTSYMLAYPTASFAGTPVVFRGAAAVPNTSIPFRSFYTY